MSTPCTTRSRTSHVNFAITDVPKRALSGSTYRSCTSGWKHTSANTATSRPTSAPTWRTTCDQSTRSEWTLSATSVTRPSWTCGRSGRTSRRFISRLVSTDEGSTKARLNCWCNTLDAPSSCRKSLSNALSATTVLIGNNTSRSTWRLTWGPSWGRWMRWERSAPSHLPWLVMFS